MTAEELKAIRARAEAATKGPLKACGSTRGGCPCGYVWATELDRPVFKALRRDEEMGELFSAEQQAANAEFIAHAREDVPALLAEIERLRGLIKDLPEVARELCERPGNEDAFLVDIGDRVAEGLREHIDESGDVR